MDNFLKYYENKRFVNWVLHPTNELNEYWEDYLAKNPSEREEIEKSCLIIGALRSKDTYKSDNHEIALFSEIIGEINVKHKKSRVRRIVFTSLKYAATILFLISLGFSYHFYQKSNTLDKITKQLVVGADQRNAQLILSNGKKVLISEKESEIIYRNNGEIVINENDTVNYNAIAENEQYNQLIVPFGKKSSVVLSDGTIAHLNAGSRLVYPSHFLADSREVFLYGEGFFEVIHDKDKPFIVKTNDQEIEVLGTKFNVSAYPSDNSVETVLAEGSVKLRSKGFSFFREDYILKPNERAIYDLQGESVSISQVDASKYVSWYLGYLNLETSELTSLIKRLERYYNIQIDLKDAQLGVKTITGKLLLKDDVRTVLNVLAMATEMKVIKLNDSKYVLN